MEIFDKIRSMSLQRQIILAAGIIGILLFVLGSVYFVFLRQPDAVLFSKLRPMDAATIVAELDKKKVPYHLADGGATILVAENQVDATRLAILSQDLPLKGAVGFELFNKSDIGLTEFAQKINYQRALQGELARTIMTMDAIDTARVHLSLPEPTIFRDDKRPPKASIALTLKPGKPLALGTVAGIRRLVAAAVPDLDVANVVVVDGEGEVISTDSATVVADWETPGQHAAEVYYADTVQQVLKASYPTEAFTVKVAASPVFSAPVSDNEDAGTDENAGNVLSEPFLNWAPSRRHFQVKIKVFSPVASDQLTQQSIRVAVGAAIGVNPDLGDDIMVTAADPGPADAVSDETATTTPHDGSAVADTHIKKDAASKAPSGPGVWIAFLAIVLIAALFLASRFLRQIMNQTRPPRRLSEAERRDIADRFRTLLERGGDHATD